MTPAIAHGIIVPMNERERPSPISDALRQTILESGFSYNSLERQTGVARGSIMRFVERRQSLRLDLADRLAEHFGLRLFRQDDSP